MRNFLRKQFPCTSVLALVAITTIITGCVPAYTSRPAADKTYQPVSSNKLGLASFAVEYYGKDVETDVNFYMLFPQSALWVPGSLRTTDWIAVQSFSGQSAMIGLVIPKTSSCADAMLSAQMNAPIHLWGTVISPADAMVGSVIVVDKCQ